MVDEIRHVGFAQEWLRRLGAGKPSVTLQAVAAMSQLKTMAVALTPAGQKMEHEIPVNAGGPAPRRPAHLRPAMSTPQPVARLRSTRRCSPRAPRATPGST